MYMVYAQITVVEAHMNLKSMLHSTMYRSSFMNNGQYVINVFIKNNFILLRELLSSPISIFCCTCQIIIGI